MKPYLSVIIPSYNEMRNLKRGVLDEVVNYLSQQDYSWEVILSDDGSTDGTLDELKKFASKHARVKVLVNPHKGKAPTVNSGMRYAQGKWRLFTDFDQSTPLKEIEKLWPYAKQGYDVMIGSREMTGSRRDKEPFYRHLMGRGFNIIVQIFAIPGLRDTQCGFKMFSEEATQQLFNKLVIYGSEEIRKDAFLGAYDVELLFIAIKSGFKVKEVPIFWQHYRTERLSPIKDSFRMFRDVLRIRLAYMMGRYQLTAKT